MTGEGTIAQVLAGEARWAVECERLRAEEQNTTLQAARAGQLPMFGERA